MNAKAAKLELDPRSMTGGMATAVRAPACLIEKIKNNRGIKRVGAFQHVAFAIVRLTTGA
jgi:hypothetical protein